MRIIRMTARKFKDRLKPETEITIRIRFNFSTCIYNLTIKNFLVKNFLLNLIQNVSGEKPSLIATEIGL